MERDGPVAVSDIAQISILEKAFTFSAKLGKKYMRFNGLYLIARLPCAITPETKASGVISVA
ncbi:hypothetical protein [Pseudoxanthomonas sp. JBR18]|uniref:hypothetical protein n=1 Tax=Pseudoxanthomonas sp. JBR18 TaxID=2969308 RepID=UPI002306285E|nr:hypothetical protein [Pseudoxanthomonas sp. JBR18]WCE03886.1 hypothetical protein PJ250_17640 [Pseudoxanthomonas sp. JBR18]